MLKLAPVRDALWFHGVFFLITVPLAAWLRGPMLGYALCLFALVYNIALPLWGSRRGHTQWVAMWQFLLPVSFALPLADWMLVNQLGTLSFPGDGVPRIGGAVPIYFLGMWVMLLWQVMWFAEHTGRPYLAAAGFALAGFVGWEWIAPFLALWEPVGVRMWAGIALYVIVPEVLMVLATMFLWHTTQAQPRAVKVAAALGVAPLYAGLLAWSHMLIN